MIKIKVKINTQVDPSLLIMLVGKIYTKHRKLYINIIVVVKVCLIKTLFKHNNNLCYILLHIVYIHAFNRLSVLDNGCEIHVQ